MKSSTKDKAKGKFHEVKGKIKEVVGKLSDAPNLEAEGTGERWLVKFRRKSARSRKFWAPSGSFVSFTKIGDEPKTKSKTQSMKEPETETEVQQFKWRNLP